MSENQLKALKFWRVSIQYLHLSQSCSEECAKANNEFVVVTDEEISLDEYQEKTKWSDFNLAIPVLFNFYHGLETLLKGFLTIGGLEWPKEHKLSAFFISFKEHYPDSGLIGHLNKYLSINDSPELLKGFFDEGARSIDMYYQALKYPESTKGQEYDHLSILFKGAGGSEFYSTLSADIGNIRCAAVSEGKALLGI